MPRGSSCLRSVECHVQYECCELQYIITKQQKQTNCTFKPNKQSLYRPSQFHSFLLSSCFFLREVQSYLIKSESELLISILSSDSRRTMYMWCHIFSIVLWKSSPASDSLVQCLTWRVTLQWPPFQSQCSGTSLWRCLQWKSPPERFWLRVSISVVLSV